MSDLEVELVGESRGQEASDEQCLELLGPGETAPLDDYVSAIANRKLRRYRSIVQTGKKEGQTYYSHVLDGVMLLGRLCELKPLGITDIEARCLFLGFTAHDINKLQEYSGRKYADSATDAHIATELDNLDASSFFGDWRAHLQDIATLARLHQAHLAVTLDGLDRRSVSLLDEQAAHGRVRQLGYLIQGVDELALSDRLDERPSKGKFLNELNAACPSEQYRFVTHRLSEYRGILTNVMHNCVVAYLREKYPDCLDLLYYPDGVAYLFPKRTVATWDGTDTQAVAERVTQRLAELQADQLGQFIKGRPFGIAVDKAAIESGASSEEILDAIYAIVARKRYTEDRSAQREADVRNDLQSALDSERLSPEASAEIQTLLLSPALLPADEARLRCGDFAAAYRNLINDHGAIFGLRISDSWEHLYQVLELPTANYPIYNTVNSYRRGFFIVRDLPADITDIAVLRQRFLDALGHAKSHQENGADAEAEDREGEVSDESDMSFTRSLTDYLTRMLLVSEAGQSHDFSSYLRQYVTEQNRQCCNCSTMAQTHDWMTVNVPASIGVQTFSNRLEGGALREPKRQICPICRAQFILEKIAWMGHSSKMGLSKTNANGTKTPGYSTFYLYLFPHSYFTEPFLKAWSAEIQRLRDQETTAFVVDLNKAFREWEQQSAVPIRPTKMTGVALPQLAEASSNIPILPINAPGQNYGEQFMMALQKAVVLRAFFGCRVALSRLPEPPVDAVGLQTLFIDGLPRNLLRLVAGPSSGSALYEHEANLNDAQVAALEQRLRWLHQLSDALYIPLSDRDLVHDLAVEMGDDPLRLYHELDRAIEEKAAAETKGGKTASKGITPEMRATALSRLVAPIARNLVGA